MNQVKQDSHGLDEILVTKVAKGTYNKCLSELQKSNPIIEISIFIFELRKIFPLAFIL